MEPRVFEREKSPTAPKQQRQSPTAPKQQRPATQLISDPPRRRSSRHAKPPTMLTYDVLGVFWIDKKNLRVLLTVNVRSSLHRCVLAFSVRCPTVACPG